MRSWPWRTILVTGLVAMATLAVGCGTRAAPPTEVAASSAPAHDTIAATSAIFPQELASGHLDLVWMMLPVEGSSETTNCTSPEPGVVVCERHRSGIDAANYGGHLGYVTEKVVTTTADGCEMSDGRSGALVEVEGVPGAEKYTTVRGEEIYFSAQSRSCTAGSDSERLSGGFVITGGTGRFEGATATMAGVSDPLGDDSYRVGLLRVRAELWAGELTPPVAQARIIAGGTWVVEGDDGQTVVEVPVTLAHAWDETVTVEWATLDTGEPGIATADVDYVAASGIITFEPGETAQTISITVNGDTEAEPPLVYGEWGLIELTNPSSNAVVDATAGLDGRPWFVIVDDESAG